MGLIAKQNENKRSCCCFFSQNGEKYVYKLYKEWFWGSHGKKITIAKTRPDDFKLIYPKVETKFHYVIPSLGIESIGDYSITYDIAQVEPKDYYGKASYNAYNYGDEAYISIDNLYAGNNKSILLIKDSFARCVVPFLALGCQHLDVIDLCLFTGSIKEFINQHSLDIVIILYSGRTERVELRSHEALFDFRQ